MPLWSITLLLLLVGSTARAAVAEERQLPLEIDLRAAYCLPIVRDMYRGLEEAISLGNTSDNPELKALGKEILDGAAEDLRRLQQYLFPRLWYLEQDGVFLALQRGKKDSAKLDTLTKTCSATCDQRSHTPAVSLSTCMQRCYAADPLGARIKACHDMYWLPF
jgi:hypothetical protein